MGMYMCTIYETERERETQELKNRSLTGNLKA